MAMAAPVARAAAGKAAQSTAGKGTQAAAGKVAQSAGGKGTQAAAAAGAVPPGKGKGPGLELPEGKGPERKGQAKKWGRKAVAGSSGKYRRILIAEFIVCMLLLGMSPLAKGEGEMGPVRFMKRGTATAAMFVILGLISSFGAGAARASAAFGGLCTLVLLVDQKEAFGKIALLLGQDDKHDVVDVDPAGVGPDDATDAGPDLVQT